MPVRAATRPIGTTKAPPTTRGWRGRELAFEGELAAATFEPFGGVVGALTGPGRVELGVALPGEFLVFELEGLRVPVADLFGEALFDGGEGGVDPGVHAGFDLGEVGGRVAFDRVPERDVGKAGADPFLLGDVGQGLPFVVAGRAVVDVGGDDRRWRRCRRRRSRRTRTAWRRTPSRRDGRAVDDLVFEVDERTRLGAGVVGVDEDGALLQELSVAQQQHADRRVEQRVSGSDERGRSGGRPR
ncbi:MAG: hypothetical protein M5T61_20025 [Acidimicrobiia bacterium]|nr:hypothetical protein [Acidimicrobiia bacterium]